MRALFIVLMLFAFVPSPSSMAMAEEVYICPMHPHIHGEKGEKCPICGMDLVPKAEEKPSMSMPEKKDDMSSSSMQDNTIQIDANFTQALGIKTSEVAMRDFGRHIKAFGEVVPSTRNEHAVNMRTEGWIVDLAVSAVGDTVKKGDLLFTYYSPDLMAVQTDYILGRRIGNPEQRLRIYGMDNKSISVLKKNGAFLEATPFYAPVNGTVVSLDVRKGSFVKEGGNVLSMQDFKQVWVNADVPIKDLRFLAEGQAVKIKVPETNRTYDSTIDFIHHVANPQTRTGIVRMVVDHAGGEPKPGSYVDVVFDSDVQSRLSVPMESVLYSARGAMVIEDLGKGVFRPTMIEIGLTAEGYTEIISGLTMGQEIVTSGQFMIDAESNLRGGMAQMEGMDMKKSEMPNMIMEETPDVH